MTLASWFHFGEVNLQGSSNCELVDRRVGRKRAKWRGRGNDMIRRRNGEGERDFWNVCLPKGVAWHCEFFRELCDVGKGAWWRVRGLRDFHALCSFVVGSSLERVLSFGRARALRIFLCSCRFV